jgi:hypothetical protein
VLLSQSGSYRLTSSLDVPANGTGIIVNNVDTTLDLGGFTIASTFVCCAPAGSGTGIQSPVSRIKVLNGIVSGFGLHGIQLGGFSHVEGVLVRQVGGNGIELGNGGLALANRVTQVGESGLRFVGNVPGMYRDNVLSGTAQASGSTATALAGYAHASGGNYCEDASCSRRGARRYYLTKTVHTGDQPIGACDVGFHFASLHEIRDPSALEYDGIRGRTGGDASIPGGPVTNFLAFSQRGWVRTGYPASGATGVGSAHCDNWTTAASTADGTVARLSSNWDADPDAYARWEVAVVGCDGPQPFRPGVWCVED